MGRTAPLPSARDADPPVPVPATPDYRGLALLVLSAAIGVALVLMSTAVFIRLVHG